MKRRTVLWMGLGTVGALAVGVAVMPMRQRLIGDAEALGRAAGFAPNAWVSINPDNTITLFMPRAEMGQGTHTGLAMLLAEELGCVLSAIRIEPAPIARVYNNIAAVAGSAATQPLQPTVVDRATQHFMSKFAREFGFMLTGGSSSIADLFVVLREAGAMARETLRAAAARHWSVPVKECVARAAQIVHESGKFIDYGDIVALGPDLLEPVHEYTLKKPAEWTLIGTAAKRLESRDKVTGRALFAADIHEPGMLYAEFSLSPFFDGEIEVYDEAAARAVPGVVEVLQIAAGGGAPAAVAVVAEQRWRAQRAVSALNAQWVAGAAGPFNQQELDAKLLAGLRDDAEVATYQDAGDLDAVIENSGAVVRADYEVPFLAHAAMEPLCCAVKFDDDRATVWAGVQIPNLARKAAALALGLEPEQVTLNPLLVGGAFGRRLDADFVRLAAAVARAVPGRLVQALWRREDDMRHDFYRPAVRARYAGVLELGRGLLIALKAHSASPSVIAQAVPRQLGLPGTPSKADVEGAVDQGYEIPNHRVQHTHIELPVPLGFWRSVGHSQHAFFQESFIDESAAIARIDPLEFRLRHLQSQPRPRAVLELVARQSNWKQAPVNAGDGKPVARGIALHESFGSVVAAVAEVSQGEGGKPRVHRIVVAIDCGVAINPNLIRQQVESSVIFGLSAALYGQISIKDGRVVQGNFDSYPVLRLDETPVIDISIMPSALPPGGVGEPALPPVAPAVASALAALTGRRHRRLPLIGA
ncbi:MAG: xanthine dehydrogenase family protein molybdopterin-binding subunit [Gammaproteobacteria bacterium]|nr:xanthine dehydrogenase family protein molybdopterin-binding subunit [Gammaproteobacteria bacterium]